MKDSKENGTARPLAIVTDTSHSVGQRIARHFAESGYALFLAGSPEFFIQEMRELHQDSEIHAYPHPLVDENDANLFYREIAAMRRPVAALALSDPMSGASNSLQIILSPIAKEKGETGENPTSPLHSDLFMNEAVDSYRGR